MKLEMGFAMGERTLKFVIMMAEIAANLLLNSSNVTIMDVFVMKTAPSIPSHKVISRKIIPLFDKIHKCKTFSLLFDSLELKLKTETFVLNERSLSC